MTRVYEPIKQRMTSDGTRFVEKITYFRINEDGDIVLGVICACGASVTLILGGGDFQDLSDAWAKRHIDRVFAGDAVLYFPMGVRKLLTELMIGWDRKSIIPAKQAIWREFSDE